MNFNILNKKLILGLIIIIFSTSCSFNKNKIIYVKSKSSSNESKSYNFSDIVFTPVYSKKAMVVSANSIASEIGLSILKKGGNAIDAAVAVGFALAVLLPNAGNIGGGGFMLYYDSNNNKVTTIDFRETAPYFASKDMFLDSNSNLIEGKSISSHYAVGVPGTVAGLEYAWKKWGSIKWSELVYPAIVIAKQGYKVSANLARRLKAESYKMSKYKATKDIFWKGNIPLEEGDLLIQKDLGNSLTLIANEGAKAFYKGAIAKKIVQEMLPYKGAISLKDLANYKVVEREPIQGSYKGYTIFSMPPPSSGGILIVEILNILENYPIEKLGHNSAQAIHYIVEAIKYAYADRSFYLGDKDFVSVPEDILISKEYAKYIADKISNRITSSIKITHGNLNNIKNTKHNQTTHFSIIDKNGNVVSLTYTLNTNFGTGIVAKDTGILLNNEMDDFATKPGFANVYGLIGNDNNAIEAGKRPLSSMSPTIILKDGKPFLITGSPGGSRIITTVLQTILNAIDFKLNCAENLNSLRFHHQWLPDVIVLEKGFSKDTINLLIKQGYNVSNIGNGTIGIVQIIKVNSDSIEGYSDLRNTDGGARGY